MEDNSAWFRWKMCNRLLTYARTTNCPTGKRQEIIEFLVRRLGDASENNRGRVEEELLTFYEDDFNDEAKRLIRERFDASGKTLVLLTGLVDPDYCYQRIKHRLALPVADVHYEDEKPQISALRWEDMLAAARWGDKEWMNHLIWAVEDDKDRGHWNLQHFRQLHYVLQPEMIDYMRRRLNDDTVVPSRMGPGNVYYALEAANELRMMLKGFPLVERGEAHQDYTKTCREWMAQQKKWEFITVYSPPRDMMAEMYREREAICGMTNILQSIASLKEWPSDRESPEQWMKNKCPAARWNLCSSLFFRYAQTTNCSPTKRKEIIELLARQLKEFSADEVSAEENLLTLREADFSDEAKRAIKERFDSSGCSNVVRLAGLVDIEYCYARIKPRLKLPVADIRDTEEPRISETRWGDMLVAARWGDKEWTKRLIKAVESEKKPPEWRIVSRLPLLRYVLQPEVVEYLHGHLDSDFVLKTDEYEAPSDVSFAWLAARELMVMLKGFPPYRPGIGQKEYIKICREWMAQQKKWEFVR
jgi:hypothetical protein